MKALDEVTIQTHLKKKKFQVGLVAKEYQIGKTRRSRQIVPVYDSKIIPFIAELFKERPMQKFDTIALFTGQRRMGKTTLAAQIARAIDPNFDVKHIAFRVEEFNNIIHTNPPADPKNNVYPQVILDEAGYDLYNLNWFESVQKNLVKKFEVIGAKRQIVSFVLPHRMMLNRGVRESLSQYWINISVFDGERGFAELRVGQENIWKLEAYWRPLCAFTFEPFKDDDPFWMEYNIKKTGFIDDVTGGELEVDKSKATRLMTQRDVMIRELYATGKYTMEAIGKKTGLDPARISQIINPKK